jgi:hypothetical protein
MTACIEFFKKIDPQVCRISVVSRIFRTFGLAERHPAGSRGDGTSHLLILQQLDVQISLGRPCRAGDVA